MLDLCQKVLFQSDLWMKVRGAADMRMWWWCVVHTLQPSGSSGMDLGLLLLELTWHHDIGENMPDYFLNIPKKTKKKINQSVLSDKPCPDDISTSSNYKWVGGSFVFSHKYKLLIVCGKGMSHNNQAYGTYKVNLFSVFSFIHHSVLYFTLPALRRGWLISLTCVHEWGFQNSCMGLQKQTRMLCRLPALISHIDPCLLACFCWQQHISITLTLLHCNTSLSQQCYSVDSPLGQQWLTASPDNDG